MYNKKTVKFRIKDPHPKGWGSLFVGAAGIRLHFRFAEIMELIPSSRDQATVRWTVGLGFSNPASCKTKIHPLGVDFYFGGAAGIRTLAALSCPTRFRVTPLRPA